VRHHFTVDVEEYFQVSAFDGHVPRRDWEGLESRVSPAVHRLLNLLALHEAKGTFFVLGWIARRHPDLVRAIAAEGHEVASHGWEHIRVTHQTPALFRACVGRSKSVLEEITGRPVTGYRAPSFSIVRGREWALDILLEEGYRYDSSLFPVLRRGYGYANGRRDPHLIGRARGTIAEVPPTTLRVMGINLPAAGGAYLRLFPYSLVRRGLLQAENRGVPGTVYIHPWEVDPDQPRIAAPWPARLRHYSGLTKTMPRLKRLLEEFEFQPIECTVDELARQESPEGSPMDHAPPR
jgi:polysaccharide deacetylase family protein (PEP-CTERM system associated)